MAVVTAMLYEIQGREICSHMSMDDCAQEWTQALPVCAYYGTGTQDEGFVNYVSDEKVVAFPWTMIDNYTSSK